MRNLAIALFMILFNATVLACPGGGEYQKRVLNLFQEQSNTDAAASRDISSKLSVLLYERPNQFSEVVSKHDREVRRLDSILLYMDDSYIDDFKAQLEELKRRRALIKSFVENEKKKSEWLEIIDAGIKRRESAILRLGN